MTDSTAKPAGEDTRRNVLQEIRDRHLGMRPRWHFVLRGAAFVAGAIVALLCVLYLASLVVFLMRHTGAWFVPAFGARGWFALFGSLPWAIMLAIAAFVLVLELMMRRYAFAYRRPLVYSVLALVVIVFVGGVAVGMTPLHGRIASAAKDRDVPLFGMLYRVAESWHRDDVHEGTIAGFTPDGFVFDEYDGDVLDVRVSPATRFQVRLPSGPAVGDTAVVFGSEEDGAIRAVGVRTLSPSDVE